MSSFTALRMPFATFKNASSRFGQRVIAFPSDGSTLSLPNRALFQSAGRRIIGITRASPLACRSLARNLLRVASGHNRGNYLEEGNAAMVRLRYGIALIAVLLVAGISITRTASAGAPERATRSRSIELNNSEILG